MVGSFNDGGNPAFTFMASGVIAQNRRELTAMMDTGFSGFLMLPLTLALPLGLVLIGTAEYVLADGSKNVNLTAIGTMEFLKESGMKLLVDPVNGVVTLE